VVGHTGTSMKKHDWRRVCFVGCGTAVVAVPLIQYAQDLRASYWDPIAPVFYAGVVGLFIASIVFYKSERILSCIGFVAVALAVLWLFFTPVLAE
jgi:hypothetical protein